MSGTRVAPPVAETTAEVPQEAMEVQVEDQSIPAQTSQGVKRGFSPDHGSSEESKKRSLGHRQTPSGPKAMRAEDMAVDSEPRDGRHNGVNSGGNGQVGGPGGAMVNHPGHFQPGPNFGRGRGHPRGRGGHHGANGRE